MIGPWSHAFPHEPYPKPGMEWRHEAVRWLDQWLKGIDTGIMDEPRFAVYVRDWHPPGRFSSTPRVAGAGRTGGRSRGSGSARGFRATIGSLVADAPAAVHHLRYVPSIGVEGGGPVMWWGDVAHDQRPTDAFSLVYDSAPLASSSRSSACRWRSSRSPPTRRARTGSCDSPTLRPTAR